MSLLSRIRDQFSGEESRDNETTSVTIADWAKLYQPGAVVNFNGRNYQAYQTSYSGLANSGLYQRNAIVFACEARRLGVFAEARFQYQAYEKGRPGRLYGSPDLAVFDEPWPGATLRELLITAEFDVATSGNSYWVRDPNDARYFQRIDPSRMKILMEAIEDPVSGGRIGERLLGYAYVSPNRDEITRYTPKEVAHFKPYPSAIPFLGQSWITPCLNEVDADDAMTTHKRTTVRDGASLRTIVSLDPSLGVEEFKKFVELFRSEHEGPYNSGKTLFLGGGADVKTASQTFADLSLHALQGAGETRIAACAGVHPVVAGLIEGMKGSSLNSGNYTAAKRNFVDGTMRPLWGAFAEAFHWLVKVPAGSRLWYDDRDIAFLREDIVDQATILHQDATTIRTLTDAGFKPDAVIEAVDARDLAHLRGQHTGLFSVQLQPPLTAAPSAAPPQPPVPGKAVVAAPKKTTAIGNGNGKPQ